MGGGPSPVRGRADAVCGADRAQAGSVAHVERAAAGGLEGAAAGNRGMGARGRLDQVGWAKPTGETPLARGWVTSLLPTLLGLMMSLPVYALDIQGHRGARGLSPENTLPAFQRALDLGVTTLELDCGVTRD